MSHSRLLLVTAALAVAACHRNAAEAPATVSDTAPRAGTAWTDAALLAQGEYMVKMAGCNDCHTPGYGENAGNIPKERWLVGSPVGYSGPWGTTYPTNLRLKLADMDEAAWLKYSGELHTRPIMPDFNLRAMKEQDRVAVYRFIRSLGPAGQPAPAYLPPGQQPNPPYFGLVLPAGAPPEPVAVN